MPSFFTRATLLALTMAALMAIVVSYPRVVGADENLLQEIIRAGPGQIETLLNRHRPQLDDDLLGDLVRSGVDRAESGDLAEGQRQVKLADYIDAYRKRGKPYVGAGQNALTIDLLQRHQYPAAIQVEGDLAKTHPELFRPHFLLGTAYLDSGQAAAAVEQLESAVRLVSSNEEAHLELAYAYLRLDRPAEARREFKKVLDINPSDGRARDAIDLLNGKAGSDQQLGPADPTAAEHFDKAEHLFEARQYAQAIDEYQQALIADPALSKAAVFSGDAWLQLGEVDKAIAAYRQAIAINPRDRQAHRFLGDLYEKVYDRNQQQKYLDDAIMEYQLAIKADPTYQTAVDDLSRAQAKKDSLP